MLVVFNVNFYYLCFIEKVEMFFVKMLRRKFKYEI